MKKVFYTFAICSLLSARVFAAGETDASGWRYVWGGGAMNPCAGHGIAGSEACIGQSAADGCNYFSLTGVKRYAILMMVAKEITDKGALFCPIQLETDNGSEWRDGWTLYFDASGADESKCVWLCRKGYTGDKCELRETEVKSCDSTLVNKDTYAGISLLKSATNIEQEIAMFTRGYYYECYKGKTRDEEHDMFLGIVKWTVSGHGAFVRQMIFRADMEDKYFNRTSSPNISMAKDSKEILVCKNGYKPNATETDCEPIKRDLCFETQADMLAASCSGWTGFDQSIHTLTLVGDCYQYRCSQPGYAFPSAGVTTCVPCSDSNRSGVSPKDGICIRCETGKVFNEKSPSSGYCSDTIALSKTDMMYGRGKTKSTVQDIDDQCWTILDFDSYRSCVLGNSVKAKAVQVANVSIGTAVSPFVGGNKNTGSLSISGTVNPSSTYTVTPGLINTGVIK